MVISMVMSQALLRPKSSSLLNGLLAYWLYREAVGVAKKDSRGGHHLSDANNVAQSTGKFGYGAGFTNGQNQILTQTDDALKLLNWTVASWIQFGSTAGEATQRFFSRRELGGGFTWEAYRQSSKLSYIVYANSTPTSVTSTLTVPNDGTWSCVFLQSDNSGAIGDPHKMYQRIFFNDGVERDETKSNTYHANGPDVTTAPFCVGNILLGGAGHTTGITAVIDETAVWNRALSLSECQRYYNSNIGRRFPGQW